MRVRSLLVPLILASLGTGCVGSPTGVNPYGVFLAVTGTVDAGTTLTFRVVNNSRATVQVGALSCYVETDRLEGNRWTEHPRESGSCILPGYAVEPGKSRAFPLAAPATAGTYRLRALVAGDSVFSAGFEVR
ncbi:MAG: hypothetical protein V4503_11095 [Gemmatimonadota bacterium]